jgi:hypothetical protein
VKLYVYKRVDGTYWADYSEKVCARRGTVVDFFEVSSRDDYERLAMIDYKTYPSVQDRIRSLAERGLDEYVAKLQAILPVPPPIIPIDPPKYVEKPAPKRSWFDYFRLFTVSA